MTGHNARTRSLAGFAIALGLTGWIVAMGFGRYDLGMLFGLGFWVSCVIYASIPEDRRPWL